MTAAAARGRRWAGLAPAALAWAAFVLALAPAAPAGAAFAPAPAVRDFDALTAGAPLGALYPGLTVTPAAETGCGSVAASASAHTAPNVLTGLCERVAFSFAEPQAFVAVFVSRRLDGADVTVRAQDAAGSQVASSTPPSTLGAWQPVTVTDPFARIVSVTIGSCVDVCDADAFDVDDLSHSPVMQPDTQIVAAPPVETSAATAVFEFQSGAPGASFSCALDDEGASACGSPQSFVALGAGPHSLAVTAIDAYGNRDPTPAFHIWRVRAPTPTLDTDADGVPDADDNCPDTPNRDQADRDRDRTGDACEVLPSGSIEPVAGVSILVRALSGRVFIALPGAAARRSGRVARPTRPDPGYVPLTGVASLPVGTRVDTRAGRVSVTSAADFRRPTDPAHGTQVGRLARGMFVIRQAGQPRLKPAPRRPVTEIALVTPSGAASPCRRAGRARRVVRSLVASATGVFRMVGAASIATLTGEARWVTTDRCNGTLTRVSRGRVAVYDKRRKVSRTIRAGRSYVARARPFATRAARAASGR